VVLVAAPVGAAAVVVRGAVVEPVPVAVVAVGVVAVFATVAAVPVDPVDVALPAEPDTVPVTCAAPAPLPQPASRSAPKIPAMAALGPRFKRAVIAVRSSGSARRIASPDPDEPGPSTDSGWPLHGLTLTG
jgi:hypothetical protein